MKHSNKSRKKIEDHQTQQHSVGIHIQSKISQNRNSPNTFERLGNLVLLELESFK